MAVTKVKVKVTQGKSTVSPHGTNFYCMWMTHRPNAITHTQKYTVLPWVVFIIFGLITTLNLCPLTQNPGDATAAAQCISIGPVSGFVCVCVCVCVFVGVFVFCFFLFVCLWVCYHDNSKLRASLAVLRQYWDCVVFRNSQRLSIIIIIVYFAEAAHTNKNT